MFDGVADQFHQFIASSSSASSAAAARTTALPLPLSFPHHLQNLVISSNGFTSFVDPNLYTSNSHHHHHHHHQLPPHQQQQPHFLHPLHHHHHQQQQHQPSVQKNIEEKGGNNINTSLVGMNMEEEIEIRERSISMADDHNHIIPWSNDEVLALLRIRSSLENWFPEFTNWEHVSRRLAELGFKRSAEKCKEKFEEESRYFNANINCSSTTTTTKNCRIFSELEELCQGENPHHHNQQVVAADNYEKNNKNLEKSREEEEDEDNMGQNNYQNASAGNNDNNAISDQDNENVVQNNKLANNNYNNKMISSSSSNKKRKRSLQRKKKKFEMLKGFCEDIVNKLMAQQEEVHNKLIENMVKRDEEEIAREEAWKKKELDRINQELELRVKEQAVAGDRLAAMIKFLTKFSSKSKQRFGVGRNIEDLSSTSSLMAAAQSPNPSTVINNQNKVPQNPNPKTPQAPQNPNPVPLLPPPSPLIINKAPQKPTSNVDKEDIGKRWPRDEVLALINLRCSLNNYNNGSGAGGDIHDDKEGGGAAMKAPLWERISQGMLELGYKRSAKRCKEKWENINKYFRKTKDNVNKKRSLDSRTCPYFHQLSTLYNQGTVLAPSAGLPESHSSLQETGSDSSHREAN